MAVDSLTVALTGATGFVGRHTLAKLTAAGYRVRALARDPARLNAGDGRDWCLAPRVAPGFGPARGPWQESREEVHVALTSRRK